MVTQLNGHSVEYQEYLYTIDHCPQRKYYKTIMQQKVDLDYKSN